MPLFENYKRVHPSIINLFCAEICIQFINAGFFLILLIYMQKCGYKDYEAAQFIKFRFLSVLLFAIPIGIFIRQRKIKPLFIASGIALPICSFFIIWAVEHHMDSVIYVAQFVWGIGFVGLQTAALPFILRNSNSGTLTEGISLNHSTWSIAGTLCGISIFSLHQFFPNTISEREMLYLFAALGLGSLYFVAKIKHEIVPQPIQKKEKEKHYDWNVILQATFPTVLIAVGAGLTIPFISLFFYNVHGIDSDYYSLLASLALTIVFFATLTVPIIKNRFGFRFAVPFTQSIAIVALVALAFTETIHHTALGISIAIFCYLIRQPLMNMAGPMTSEITMTYVGKKNQEMMSAITASIWSGSWFISAQVFEILREKSFSYMSILLITSLLYSSGVVAYIFLIRAYERKIKEQTELGTLEK